MKIQELLESEDRTPNLDIRVTDGDWSAPRLFIEASVRPGRDDTPDWIKQAKGGHPVVAVEVTLDLVHAQKEGYINHILAHSKGKGYAAETIKWIAKTLKARGFTSIMCYIENSNSSSKSMAEKAGLKPMRREKHGEYWGKKL